MAHHPGDPVVLDDGEEGVVVSAADDGTLRIKTETAIIVSSTLDDAEE